LEHVEVLTSFSADIGEGVFCFDVEYEGQVIGNTSKGEEMMVNPTKGKQLTNMRSKSADEALNLVPPFILSIERALEVMAEDEYLEITPTSVRLRKQFLTENDRIKSRR
jgi:GTP-binding protein